MKKKPEILEGKASEIFGPEQLQALREFLKAVITADAKEKKC